MSVEIIVKLDAAAEGDLRERTLTQCAIALGASLTPLHAHTADRELASYFVATLDAASADAMLVRLRRCPGVDAAYMKTQGVPPGRT